MLRNYFKIGFRNLIRQRESSAINIFGLAVGLASSIFILLWIDHETSHDEFHQFSDSTYRLTSHINQFVAALTPVPLATALQDEFIEVDFGTRISVPRTHLLSQNNISFEEKQVLYVDSNFFKVFSFPLVEGDIAEAMKNPESILMTEDAATKYFGRHNPIGKTLRLDDETNLTVTGILANISNQSHLQFDLLLPMELLARTNRDLQNNSWDNFDWYSYVSLRPGVDRDEQSISELQGRINAFYLEKEDELAVQFALQPITDIHLTPGYMGDVAGLGNGQYVFILSIAVILLLLIATINFMNLATAKATDRAKEVGFRKVVGARRKQLVGQFLTESSLIAFFAFLLALGIVVLLMPSFTTLTGVDLIANLKGGRIILIMVVLTLTIGLLAGTYPAFYLSNFKPQAVFSMQYKAKGRHALFRNALVVTQFFFSILFIVGTIVIYKQQQFIKHQNLGYDRENLIYIPLNKDLLSNIEAFRERLEQNPQTENSAFSSSLPTDLVSGTVNINWEGKNAEEQIIFATLGIDEGFVDVFGMSMRSGRSFDQQLESDQTGYLVNEEALDLMEMTAEDAVGRKFNLWGTDGQILGVVANFHYKPIRQPIDPMVIRYEPNGGFAIVRTAPGQTEETISTLENISKDIAPSYPFEFGFVDDDLDKLYKSEQRLGSLVNIFALIAIFVSCLGLYGLSAFLATQRKKEVGVRKVLGASVFGIVIRLSKDFTRPIWISMLIALPVAYFGANRWLENFAYHIDLSWWILVGSCAAAWMIALLTTSVETIRVAQSNPIDAIHSE